ncbi:MAG: hypothetical protein GC191_06825 [Azospirillum sp.]|nr:hypothetical protein [Azospirillum sp.]
MAGKFQPWRPAAATTAGQAPVATGAAGDATVFSATVFSATDFTATDFTATDFTATDFTKAQFARLSPAS